MAGSVFHLRASATTMASRAVRRGLPVADDRIAPPIAAPARPRATTGCRRAAGLPPPCRAVLLALRRRLAMNGTHTIHIPLQPEQQHRQAGGKEESELRPVAREERSVVDGLDQIRAAVGRLQDAPGSEIDLRFPAAVQPHLHQASARPHVETIDVVPPADAELGNGLDARENRRRTRSTGVFPVPRCSGGCTQSHCFFICRKRPLTIMTRSGTRDDEARPVMDFAVVTLKDTGRQ